MSYHKHMLWVGVGSLKQTFPLSVIIERQAHRHHAHDKYTYNLHTFRLENSLKEQRLCNTHLFTDYRVEEYAATLCDLYRPEIQRCLEHLCTLVSFTCPGYLFDIK